jgi:hypothetical protein
MHRACANAALDSDTSHQSRNLVDGVVSKTNSPKIWQLPVTGEEVTLMGLRARPELNGNRGKVLASADEYGFVTVRLDGEGLSSSSSRPCDHTRHTMKVRQDRLQLSRSASSPAMDFGKGKVDYSIKDNADRESAWTCSSPGARSDASLVRSRVGTNSSLGASNSLYSRPRSVTPLKAFWLNQDKGINQQYFQKTLPF